MAGALRHKLAFHASVALLNISAVAAVGFAHLLPALEPRPVVAAPPPVAQPAPAPVKPAIKSGIPVRVAAPSVDVDLPVKNGTYNAATGTWTLGYDSAYYATPTVPVNTGGGTTLIYGHDLPGIFHALHQLQPGAQLAVYTDNGFIFRYRLERVQQVSPQDVTSLRSNGRPTVLLQTCSGIWSQYRTLFSFRLTSVERL